MENFKFKQQKDCNKLWNWDPTEGTITRKKVHQNVPFQPCTLASCNM